MPESIEVWAAVVGGLVGSALSGLVSVALQWSAHRRADKKEAKRTRDEDMASAYELLMALQECYSSARNYVSRVAEARQSLQSMETQGHLWPALAPLSNVPPKVNPAAGTYAVLLRMGRNDEFNRVRNAVAVHNSLSDVWKQYSDVRLRLAEQMSPEVAGSVMANGFKGSVSLSVDEMRKVEPLMAQAESLAGALSARVFSDFTDTGSALVGVLKLLEEEFGTALALEYPSKDDVQLDEIFKAG